MCFGGDFKDGLLGELNELRVEGTGSILSMGDQSTVQRSCSAKRRLAV